MDQRDSPPEKAFAALGHDTRIQIIRTLGQQEEPQSFSDLFKVVGTQDSGQFNYHLNQLVGKFIEQREDGRYRLSYGGVNVVGAIFAGEFERSDALEDIPLESWCAHCDTQLRATYASEQVSIFCKDCGEIDTSFGFPPGGLGNRSPAELTILFDRWIRSIFGLVTDGICHNCTGRIDSTLTDASEFLHPDEPACLEFHCERCPEHSTLSISSYLYLRPELHGYYYEHGIDLSEVHPWNARLFLDPVITEVSRDPWTIEASFRGVQSIPISFRIDADGAVTYLNPDQSDTGLAS